jgi:hypothetical protein
MASVSPPTISATLRTHSKTEAATIHHHQHHQVVETAERVATVAAGTLEAILAEPEEMAEREAR